MGCMSGDIGLRLGGQANVTLGNWGRNYDTAVGISNTGMTGTLTVAMTKGLFGGLSVEGAMLGARGGVNDSFYGTNTSPKTITGGHVEFPYEKNTLIDDVYDKLEQLSAEPDREPTAQVVETADTSNHPMAEVNNSNEIEKEEKDAKGSSGQLVVVGQPSGAPSLASSASSLAVPCAS